MWLATKLNEIKLRYRELATACLLRTRVAFVGEVQKYYETAKLAIGQITGEADVLPAQVNVLPAQANVLPAQVNVLPAQANVIPAPTNSLPIQAVNLPQQQQLTFSQPISSAANNAQQQIIGNRLAQDEQ
jgi:hypothetical protein